MLRLLLRRIDEVVALLLIEYRLFPVVDRERGYRDRPSLLRGGAVGGLSLPGCLSGGVRELEWGGMYHEAAPYYW